MVAMADLGFYAYRHGVGGGVGGEEHGCDGGSSGGGQRLR